MAPLLPKSSQSIGTLTSDSLVKNNKKKVTNKSDVVNQVATTGQLVSPVVSSPIQTPQQLMTPMSQEIPVQQKTVAPIQSGQQTMPEGMPLIAGNVSQESLQPKEDRKYLTRSGVKAILMNAPEGVDKGTLLDDIVGQGYIVEGYNDPQSQITQAPQRVEPQFQMGDKPLAQPTLLETLKSIGNTVKESYNTRSQKIQQGQIKYSGDTVKDIGLDLMNSLGQAMGVFQDVGGAVIGDTVKYAYSKLPEAVRRDFKERTEYDLARPEVQYGLAQIGKGMEAYNEWKEMNPDTAVATDFFINGAMTAADLVGAKALQTPLKAGIKSTTEATQQLAKKIPGVAQDLVQGAKNVKNIPGKIGDLGESAIEYGAKKLTNTVDDQGKLFKAQSPRIGQLNKKVDFENLRKNSDIANEEIVKAGFKPKDTASRADAHYKTMQKIWNDEVKSKIGDQYDIDLNPVADAIENFAKEVNSAGIVENEAQVQKLLDQAARFRKMGKVDGAQGEFIKEMLNSKINNRGDASIGDVVKNGFKEGTRELGKILDDTFSAIPGEFSSAKKRFGALKATYTDVVKAELKAARARGLPIEETFSRIEGVGDIVRGVFGLATGRNSFSDIAGGVAKVAIGKTLKKVRDPDFLIREGFEGLSKKIKKVDNLDIQKMGNRQPLPYKPNQAIPINPQGKVMMKNPQSPIPKKSSTVVIEKGVAKKPGTTKVDPKAVVKKSEIVKPDPSINKLKELKSDKNLQQVQPFENIPSRANTMGYVTQYGPIQKVDFDRGKEVYIVGGKTYKPSEVEIFKPKVVENKVARFTPEQDLKYDSLKKYKEQGQRKRSYLQQLMKGKSFEDLTPKQVDDFFELVNKRKRDDKTMEKFDSNIKGGETPVKTVPKKTQTVTKKPQATIQPKAKIETKTPTTQKVNPKSKVPIAKKENGGIMDSMKSQQLKFIQNNNPMTDDIHTGIRTIKDIKTFKESLLDPESLVYPDFTRKMAEEALKNNKITIYSSKQLDTNKAQFVTPSKMQAKDYAGSNKVYSKVVDLDEVAWINSDEGQLIGKLTPKQVAPKKSDSLISKNPLYEEAKKYRSADDMIKGLEKEGKILYHGTNAKFDVFNKSKYGTYGEGVYLTPDKAKGSYYADLRAEKGGKPELIKASLGGELKIFDNVKEYNNYAKQKLNFNDKRGVVEDVERLNKDIIADGYIGVEIRKAGDKGDLHEVVVFNPKNIKTEAQLRKIWEEANKGVPKKSSLPTKKK